jgi:hypothetical protein
MIGTTALAIALRMSYAALQHADNVISCNLHKTYRSEGGRIHLDVFTALVPLIHCSGDAGMNRYLHDVLHAFKTSIIQE